MDARQSFANAKCNFFKVVDTWCDLRYNNSVVFTSFQVSSTELKPILVRHLIVALNDAIEEAENYAPPPNQIRTFIQKFWLANKPRTGEYQQKKLFSRRIGTSCSPCPSDLPTDAAGFDCQR